MELRNGVIKITRKEMQEIKKMDHQQMERKLTAVYQIGKEDEKPIEGKWEDAVREAVQGIKGIGEKRREELIERISDAICTR